MSRQRTYRPHTLGGLIREARTKARLSVREVARRTDLTAGFLSDVELGRRNVSPENVRNIAKAIGCDAAPLVRAATKLRVARMKERIAEAEEAAL